MSYPGVAESRQIGNWGIFRLANPHLKIDDTDDDEPAVKQKTEDFEKFAKIVKDEIDQKLEVVKSYRIFIGHPFKKISSELCDGPTLLAMRTTQEDDDYISPDNEVIDLIRSTPSPTFWTKDGLLTMDNLRKEGREGVVVKNNYIIRFWAGQGSMEKLWYYPQSKMRC
jgi:hypothetical protein